MKMPELKSIFAVAACAAFAMTATTQVSFAAKAVKKDKRSMMSEDQKTNLRKRAREYCNKTYAKGGAFVERIEIQSTGKVICWIRG
jgi:hypothetical protein